MEWGLFFTYIGQIVITAVVLCMLVVVIAATYRSFWDAKYGWDRGKQVIDRQVDEARRERKGERDG